MTQFLDIHLASDLERREAHKNCHDVWSLGLPVAEHVARRESSALHQRARWIVGCLDRQVVAALASHPVRFRLHGRSLPGIGIASVHTLPAFRGQGLAQRMIRWIETFEQHEGARLSVLFCDIDPRYYERLGYTLCPAHHGWAEAAQAETARSQTKTAAIPGAVPTGWRLLPAAAGEGFTTRIPRLARLFESDHGRRALSIERSADYWQHLAARQPTAEHFWLMSPANDEAGYAWLRTAERGLVIEDHGVRDGDPAVREVLFRLVVDLARQRNLPQAGGWLPDAPPANRLFTLSPREDEITMLKSLDLSISLDPQAIAATDWLQEIDHV